MQGRFEALFDGRGWRHAVGVRRVIRFGRIALSQPRFRVRFGKTLIEAGATSAHPCTQWAGVTGR